MPGRGSNGSYRYGFNGKESDGEVSGGGNQYDYGFRIYNPRLGRFLSVDPLSRTYPWYTPYQFAGNKPIVAIDLDGLEEYIIHNFHDDKGNISLIRIYRMTDTRGKLRNNNVHKDNKYFNDKKVMNVHMKADGSKYQEPTYSDDLTKTQSKILKNNVTIKSSNTPEQGRLITAGEDGEGNAFYDGSLLRTEGTISPSKYKPGSKISNLDSYYAATGDIPNAGGLTASLKDQIKGLTDEINKNPEVSSLTISINQSIGTSVTQDQEAILIGQLNAVIDNVIKQFESSGLNSDVKLNVGTVKTERNDGPAPANAGINVIVK